MPPCQRCGRPLVAIGTARQGGKQTHGDWESRQFHKKCWVEEQQEQAQPAFGWQQRKRRQDSEIPDVAQQRRRIQEEVDRNHQRDADMRCAAKFKDIAPNCPACQTRSVVKTSRTAANPDRLFYCCSFDACDKSFLAWCEAKPPPTQAAVSPPPVQAAVSPPPRSTPSATQPAEPQRATLLERLLDASQEGSMTALDDCLRDPGCKELLNTVGAARHGSKAATPLRFAAFHGFKRVVERLLHAGALPCLCDDNFNDALSLARLGEGNPSAKGQPAERDGTIDTLARAAAADEWQLHDIDRSPNSTAECAALSISQQPTGAPSSSSKTGG